MKLKEFKHILDDDKLDLFITSHYHLMSHLKSCWKVFEQKYPQTRPLVEKDETVKIIQPTTPPPQAVKSVQEIAPARQNEAYHYQFSAENGVQTIQILTENCGIAWHAESQSLQGTPTSGNITVELVATLKDGSIQPYQFHINPDPRSLWKNIPSDPQTVFYKPDSASEELNTGLGWLIGARQRGRSHALHGTCCDDDFVIGHHKSTDIHFLVVSDGAGSAEFSRLGSQLVVNAVRKEIFQFLDKYPLSKNNENDLNNYLKKMINYAVYAAYQAQETAVKIQAEIKDIKQLSCTLLIALSFPLANGNWCHCAYWVGDGAIGLYLPDQVNPKFTLLGEVDSGQFSGETHFLTLSEVNALSNAKTLEETRIRIETTAQPAILFAMTDGVSDPKFPTDNEMQKVENWQTFWSDLQEPLTEPHPTQALESWLDFWSKGEHDDRTLAMFIPMGEIPIKHQKLSDDVALASPIESQQEKPTQIPNTPEILNVSLPAVAEKAEVNLTENSIALLVEATSDTPALPSESAISLVKKEVTSGQILLQKNELGQGGENVEHR